MIFNAREIPSTGNINISSFTINTELVFLNDQGVEVGRGNLVRTSEDIPENNYQQYQLTACPAPLTARTVLVQFTFEPSADNTSSVVIDNITLTGH